MGGELGMGKAPSLSSSAVEFLEDGERRLHIRRVIEVKPISGVSMIGKAPKSGIRMIG
jgi:hypothetical protein